MMECIIEELENREEISDVIAEFHDFVRSGFMLEENIKFCESACLHEMYRTGRDDEVTGDDLVDDADTYFRIRERNDGKIALAMAVYGYYLFENGRGCLIHARKTQEKCRKRFAPDRAENMVDLLEASINRFECNMRNISETIDKIFDIVRSETVNLELFRITKKLDEQFLGY